VVRGSACRARIWASRSGTPASRALVIAACPSEWGLMCPDRRGRVEAAQRRRRCRESNVLFCREERALTSVSVNDSRRTGRAVRRGRGSCTPSGPTASRVMADPFSSEVARWWQRGRTPCQSKTSSSAPTRSPSGIQSQSGTARATALTAAPTPTRMAKHAPIANTVGGVLSPLLANIALEVLDEHFTQVRASISPTPGRPLTPAPRSPGVSAGPVRRRLRGPGHLGRDRDGRPGVAALAEELTDELFAAAVAVNVGRAKNLTPASAAARSTASASSRLR